MPGGNAGLIRPKVSILSGSPFNSFRKQEQCFYITSETLSSSQDISHVVALPAPINGCRIEERRVAYDNYLIDENRDRLETSAFLTKLTTKNEQGQDESVQTYSEFDGTASARVKLKQISDKETPDDKAKREFFTWQCQTSIFGDHTRLFTSNPQFDSLAEWTYINVPKPGLDTSTSVTNGKTTDKNVSQTTGSSRILMPYQRKIPKDKSTPVHWGLKMNERPFNQPFELTYYICFRDASVAELAPEQRTTTGQGTANKFSFYYPDNTGKPGKPIDIKLNKGLYLAIEMGEESNTNHFVFLFAYGQNPMLFWVNHGEGASNSGSTDIKNNQTPCPIKAGTATSKAQTTEEQTTTQDGKFKAMLISSYPSDTIVDTMFNSKLFTISLESAGGCFYVRSSAFPTAPWIIHPNSINKASGLFIGETLSVYGGNIQAGLAYAPIQYFKQGAITMAGATFDVPPTGDIEPTLSVSTLGPSQILQEQSTSNDGSNERLMVDTELLKVINGVPGEPGKIREFGYVNTLLGDEPPFGEGANETPIDREIVISLIGHESIPDEEAKALLLNSSTTSTCEELIENMDVSVTGSFGAPLGLLSFRTGTVTSTTWYPDIIMYASDVKTKSGFVIPCGRSPYMWLIRLYVNPPTSASTRPTKKYDLSCDVMSIDLSWNSTGPGEISCSGSIKVLASPRAGVTASDAVPDLMALTRRISYIEIEIDRKSSIIPDSTTSGDSKIFSGCIVGADVQDEPGRTVITFKVEDYMWVLQAIKFNLSPYYDGMAYNYALADMLAQTGFPYDRMHYDQTSLIPAGNSAGPDADTMPALPCTNMFEQPQFRFKDGESIKDGMLRIAKLDWKMMYFDPKGDFHYDSIPWGMYGDQNGPTAFDFFTGDAEGWTPSSLVWNSVSRGYAMRDMYNSLQVITVSKAIPSLYLMYQDTNRDSIDDPESDGYIGFPKVMRQKEAMFERVDVAFSYFKSLRDILYLPPKTIKFETYGRVGLRPGAVVSVDGQPWRMMNINLKLDASKNEFWASIEGEWFDHKGKAQTGDPVKNAGRPPA